MVSPLLLLVLLLGTIYACFEQYCDNHVPIFSLPGVECLMTFVDTFKANMDQQHQMCDSSDAGVECYY